MHRSEPVRFQERYFLEWIPHRDSALRVIGTLMLRCEDYLVNSRAELQIGV